MNEIKQLLFDWGDTLMIDYPQYEGSMISWETVSPMPEVMDTIPILSARFPCTVASNAGDSNAERMKQAFERISLAQYFSTFITSEELGANKPSVAFFERVIDKLKVPAQEIVMIGNDYTKDIVGAKNVGMKTILIIEKQGEFPYADYIIHSFGKLKDILIPSSV